MKKEVIETLTYIEKNHSVYEWKYGDIDLWPLVKSQIHSLNNSRKHFKNTKPIIQKNILILFIESVYFFIKLLLIRKKEIIFLAAKTYRIAENNILKSKYFVPDFSNSIEIEYAKKSESKYKDENRIIFLDKLIFIFVLFFKIIPSKKRQIYTPDLDIIEKYITAQNDLSIKNALKKIEKNENYINSIICICKILLYFNKIKTLNVLCYYNLEPFLFIYVCNKHNIKTIDYQHGGQGKSHPMYLFSNLKKPLNTLPKYFYTWDEIGKEHINSWCRKARIKTINYGNSWIKHNTNFSDKNLLHSEKKIIIYTLQLEDINQFIIDAIQLTPKEYIWYIRLHPRGNHMKSKLQETILNKALSEKVEIEKANSIPLPLILESCFVHISSSSGSITEAYLLGKKSIIISSSGAKAYNEYIKTGDAFDLSSQNPQELINLIQSLNQ